jgi:NADH:ubiquinone oxidoreductase subunit 4 (subunit M)
MFIPLLVVTFLLGIYPEIFLDVLHASVKNLLVSVPTSVPKQMVF